MDEEPERNRIVRSMAKYEQEDVEGRNAMFLHDLTLLCRKHGVVVSARIEGRYVDEQMGFLEIRRFNSEHDAGAEYHMRDGRVAWSVVGPPLLKDAHQVPAEVRRPQVGWVRALFSKRY